MSRLVAQKCSLLRVHPRCAWRKGLRCYCYCYWQGYYHLVVQVPFIFRNIRSSHAGGEGADIGVHRHLCAAIWGGKREFCFPKNPSSADLLACRIYPGSSPSSGLSFRSSVKQNPCVLLMLRLDLSDFPNVCYNTANAFVFQKTRVLLCDCNGDVRQEYLGFPHSLQQNRSELIRGTDRLIIAERALLFIPKYLVNKQ